MATLKNKKEKEETRRDFRSSSVCETLLQTLVLLNDDFRIRLALKQGNLLCDETEHIDQVRPDLHLHRQCDRAFPPELQKLNNKHVHMTKPRPIPFPSLIVL